MPGQITMTLTTPGSGPTDPPTTVNEPATLLLFGLGLIAVSLRYRRAAQRRTVA
jgi:hypothetical protein